MKLKKSFLARSSLLLLGLAATALSGFVAQAVPYASGLARDGDTVSFVLNQEAQGVVVLRDGANPVTFTAPVAAGRHTFSMAGYSTYSIIVTGDTPRAWTQISSDSLTQSKYYSPRGVTVDTNPKRSTFGQIIVAEAIGGLTTAPPAPGRTTTDGLYIMSADQADFFGQGDTAFSGTIDWTTGGNSSPWRISMNRADPNGEDYTIYISDWSDSHSGIWTADALNPSAPFLELLDNTGRAPSGIVSEGGGMGPGLLHGSEAAGPWVEGVGANRIMFTLDEDVGLGTIWQYDIGTTTSGYNIAPTARVPGESSGRILNARADIVRDEDGSWWIAQYRSTDSTGVPALSHWDDGASAPSWTSGSAPVQLDNGYGSVDIFDKQDLLVIGTIASKIYVLDIHDPANPVVLAQIPHTGSTIHDVAFDAAGNIYAVSSSSESLRIYSPGGYTVATTTSDGTFQIVNWDQLSVTATDPAAAEADLDPGTFTLSRFNGATNDLLVYYTLSGTAISNVDYTVSPPSPFLWKAGEISTNITITPLEDALGEPNETVVLTLAAGSYYIGTPASATLEIADNDVMLRYWDADGATAGAGGGGAPVGTWGTDAFWSLDDTGAAATGPWSDWAVAVFSAGSDAYGTYTVNVSGTQRVGSISFEEGYVTLSGGTLVITNYQGIKVAPGLIATIDSVLTGAAGLAVEGPGTVILGGANTYTGPTLISTGTVQLAASSRIPDTSAVILGGEGMLDLSGFDETIGSLAGAPGAILNVLAGNVLTFGGDDTDTLWDGTTQGGGLLTKVGTGLINIGDSGVIGEPLTISGGTVQINSAGDLGSAGNGNPITIDNGATLEHTSDSFVNFINGRPITIEANGGTLKLAGASAILFEFDPISGPGTLTKDGPGELRTYNVEHSFAKLNVKQGLYTAGHSTSPGYNTSFGAIPGTLTPDAITIQGGAAIRKAGGMSVTLDANQGITLAGAGSKTIRSYAGDVGAGTFAIPGPISGTGPLVLGSASDLGGIIVLGGNNTYTDGTIISSANVVEVQADGGLGSGDVTVASGATLRLQMGTANTYINSAASLFLTGASPVVDLAFTGPPNTIKSLYFDGVPQAAGTWGAIGSGAQHESAFFTGSGMLNVGTSVIYAQTNNVVSLVNKGGGQFDLTLQGTPGAVYYLLSSANIAAPLDTWTPVVGSTNTAPEPSGEWTFTVTNDAPQFYRLRAVNPAP